MAAAREAGLILADPALERVSIRELITPGTWESVFGEGYLPRESAGVSGLAVPAAVTEFPGMPSLAWLRHRVELWEGSQRLGDLLTQRLRSQGYAGTAEPEAQRVFLWDHYRQHIAGDLMGKLGLTGWGYLPRFDLTGFDLAQLPPLSPASFTHFGPGWHLRRFWRGVSSVTPDPNADLATLLNRGVTEAEWAHLAQMVETIDHWNKLAAVMAPSANWRPVRQLGAVMRRYWQTLRRWECVWQPAGSVPLLLQEAWPKEDQIAYMQKFEQVKALGVMMGETWTTPIPWAVPAHPTEAEAAAHALASLTGADVPYETTWASQISDWWATEAALAENEPGVMELATSGGAVPVSGKPVDNAPAGRYILWTVAVFALAGLVILESSR